MSRTGWDCCLHLKDLSWASSGRLFSGARWPPRICLNLRSSILRSYGVELQNKLSVPKPSRSDPHGERSWIRVSGEGQLAELKHRDFQRSRAETQPQLNPL